MRLLRSQKLKKKLTALLTLFSLSLNILQPAFLALSLAPVIAPTTVKAQEVLPSDTPAPTPDESPVVTPDPTIEPTVTPTPTPDATIVPNPSPETSVAPSPTPDAVSPTPLPSLAPTLTPAPSSTQVVSNPQNNPTPGQDSAPAPPSSSEPTPTATPAPSLAPTTPTVLDATVIPFTDSSSIDQFDLSVNESGSATLSTDKLDYAPTDTALITGAGFKANTTYSLTVSSSDTPATSTTVAVTTDAKGDLFYAYQLDGNYRPNYKVDVFLGSVLAATTTFTDSNPSANLDQCANDPFPSSHLDGCSASASDWVNGNVGTSKASYFEGDSVPYRMVMDSLSLGSHQITFEWDTTKSGKHAEDFLTTYNQTVATANPCLGVAGCGAPTTFPIPSDPQVTGAGVTPIAGNFTLFGGTITAASVYTYADGAGFTGDKSARITLTFTASVANPVLAWGGHIANRTNWGANNSAISISGSPYHMRLVNLDGSGGNQDRSLSADAVIFPASITIIKQASVEGSTSFGFTASPSPLTNFSLVDDGTTANTKLFSNITNFQTYAVAETVPGGWTLSSIVCGVTSDNGGSQTVTSPSVSINLKEGENVTCTFNNTVQLGTLTINKTTVGGNGTFNYAVAGPSASSKSITTVNGSGTTGSFNVGPGTYTVTETVPAGWSMSTDCPSSFSIANGGSKVCNFTNTKQPTLTVTKVVNNNYGGTLTPGNFPLFVQGNSVTSGSSNIYDPGTYTISETQQPGYTQTSLTCNSNKVNPVVLNAGDNVSCTITNSDIQPKLTVTKVVNNTHGGTKVVADFPLFVDATGVTSGVQNGFNVGTYTVSETGSAGYTGVITGDCSANGSVSLALGDVKSCTITNSDTQPQLKVVKVVVNDNGGSKVIADFPLKVDNTSVVSGATNSFNAGSYTVSETNLPGYTATFSGDCNVSGGVTLAVGDALKTCTITNDDQPGTLIVKKIVVGSNDDESNFSFKVNGGSSVAFESDGQNDLTVNAGNYSVTEVSPGTSYSTSYDNCSNLSIPNGGSATCTITNTKLPTLTVNKVVSSIDPNESGKFNLKIDTTTYATNVGDGGTTGAKIVALGAHSVSEVAGLNTDLSLYSAATTGDCASNGSIILVAGDNKVCTITNTRKTGQILIDKILFGGTAQESDWDFTIGGWAGTFHDGDLVTLPTGSYSISESSDVLGYSLTNVGGICSNISTPSATLSVSENGGTCSFTNVRDTGSLIVNKKVDANNDGTYEGGNTEANVLGFTWSLDDGSPNAMGTTVSGIETTLPELTHSVDESIASGYHFTGWYVTSNTDHSCANPQGVTLPINVNIAKDATTNITLCNARDTGTIVVHKDVQGPNGEDLIDTSNNFTVTLDDASGQSITDGATVTYNNVTTGNHTIGESVIPSGYSLYSITPTPAAVTYGQTTDVYVVNRQQSATLYLVKHLPNDNGGKAVQDDFPVTLNDNPAVWGANTVNPGNYTAAETTKDGYTPSSWSNDCSENGNVTLLPGATKTCEITNDDIAPTLKLVKEVENDHGGNNVSGDWTLTATGSVLGFSDDGDSDTFHTVQAGVSYTLSESEIAGYTAGNWSCDKGSLDGDVITLGLAENGTCTIVNTDVAPSITLIKKVINDNGGNAGENDFGLTIGDTSVDSGEKLVVESNQSYALNEVGLTGYEFVSLTGDKDCPEVLNGTVVLSEGQNLTCTITNDDIAPTITLNKVVDGGSAGVNDFGLTIGDTSVESGETLAVDANTPYALSEAGLSGYTFSGLSGDEGCPEVLGGTVTLNEGEHLACTITNTRDTGSLTVHKIIDRDGNLQTTEDQTDGADWTFTVQGETTTDPGTTDTAGLVTFGPLNTGSYNVGETLKNGYNLVAANCGEENGSQDGNTIYSVDVNKSDTTTCTFYNTPNGTIHGYKWEDKNGDGKVGEGEDKLSGWTIELYQDDGEDGWNLIDSMVTDDSQTHFGWYWFEHLFPGQYKVCEVAQDGWKQTYPEDPSCHLLNLPDQNSSNFEVELNAVAGPDYNFGNQQAPVLTIEKKNDAVGNKGPGDIVTYTLTLGLTGSNLADVVVTDVTPEGFDYVSSSWTSSKPGVAEPNYGSPGTWNIGDMAAGDVITLTYQAKIKEGIDGGTYNDSAWASGNSDGWGEVLALGQNSSFVDGYFVGTSVNIGQNVQQTGSVDVEGEVLGAATSLPATGAPLGWLLLIISLFVTGCALILGGKRMKSIFATLVFIMAFFVPATPVHADDVNNNLSIRLESPLSPTRDNDWNLAFSILDRQARTPSATCYVKKPGAGSATQFDSTKTSVKPEGDNNFCHIDSSLMNDQGTYEFYLIASAGSDSEESSHVNVVYDTSGPGKPTSFSKDHNATCQWTIKFHTADDGGVTQKVEIYSSDQTSFDTNGSTRVGMVSIGSNQDGQFVHDRGGDCDKTWYYVIRAFDSIGNQSDWIGDTVTITTNPTTSPAPALIVTKNAQSNQKVNQGDVLGEEATPSVEPSKSPESSDGQGLVMGVKDAVKSASKGKKAWWIFDILAILGIIYVVRQKTRHQ